MRLVRKISLATGTEMRLEDLYNNNTIQEMAAWVAGQPVATAEKKGRCNDVDGFIEQPEK